MHFPHENIKIKEQADIKTILVNSGILGLTLGIRMKKVSYIMTFQLCNSGKIPKRTGIFILF